MVDIMEQAYARGDHRTARAIATKIRAQGSTTTEGAEADAGRERAGAILALTSPDRFLSGIGVVGIGLVTWLVYNYVL